jgi:hypothetical protein
MCDVDLKLMKETKGMSLAFLFLLLKLLVTNLVFSRTHEIKKKKLYIKLKTIEWC